MEERLDLERLWEAKVICASRVKIVGAQWNPANVSQILKLRCAYLDCKSGLSISA